MTNSTVHTIDANHPMKYPGSLKAGEENRYRLVVKAGHSYHIVLKPTSPTDLQWWPEGVEKRQTSRNRVNGYQVVRLRPKEDGVYFISIKGRKGRKQTNFELYVTEFKMSAPTELWGLLDPPLKGRLVVAWKRYSKWGDSWGNPESDPFFDGYEDYWHFGHDFWVKQSLADMKAKVKVPVFAVAPGKVVKIGKSSDDDDNTWGWHVAIRHEVVTRDGQTFIFTVQYEHLQEADRPAKGDEVVAGDIIGYLHDTSIVPGERLHLHVGGQRGEITYSANEPHPLEIGTTSGAAHLRKIDLCGKKFFNMGDLRLYKRRRKTSS